MAIMVTIFVLIFLVQLVNWVGQSVLLGLVYSLYLRVFYANAAKRQKALKADILAKKAELHKTSAQDQFAKWAKLRRSVDKGLADLEKLNSELSSTKSSFAFKFNAVLWIFTRGSGIMIGMYYRNAPVFWLPPGWFGPLTWWMSFPFAPRGSVSVGLWQMACNRVLASAERIVKAHFAADPNAIPAATEAKTEATSEKQEEKKKK
ncbi:CHD5-like protein-domain-containing protein [Flagelloscypha sp. PMI_526]|nr:CHD5-like protein-domain-containing protein [Flagelloscypha sp. PMI_526]